MNGPQKKQYVQTICLFGLVSNWRKKGHNPRGQDDPHSCNTISSIVNNPTQTLTMRRSNQKWRQNETNDSGRRTQRCMHARCHIKHQDPGNINTKRRNKGFYVVAPGHLKHA